MTDTTTISITTDQKAQLDDRKQHKRESYKSVIGRLLEGDSANETDTSVVTDDGKREILGRLDDIEARLPTKVAEELR